MTTTTHRILAVLALALTLSACKKSATGITDGPITISLTPSTVTLKQGAAQAFTATVSQGAVTFSVSANGGAVDATGHYTAPFAQGTYTITATSAVDTTKTATATVTVDQLDVTISPTHVRLAPGATASFSANTAGTADPSITWSATGGTIDNSGLYTAGTTTGSFAATATSTPNHGRSASATITITSNPAPVVTVTPPTVTLTPGDTQHFSAAVQYVTDSSVTWSIAPASAGTISAAGLFTAGTTTGSVDIIATSVEEPTSIGHATVTIQGVKVTVTPATITLAPGATQLFTAAVVGNSNGAVTWSLATGAQGSIAADGTYTAPNLAGTDTIIATSVADSTATGTATATVNGAAGLGYTDPTGSSWRLVKNASSTATHLILDLLAPDGATGRGLAFTLSASQAQVTWTKVASADATLVQNHAFTLGSGAQLLQGAIKGDDLAVGVFQKGSGSSADALTGPVLTIALDLKSGGLAAGGATIPITQLKGEARNAAGTTEAVTIALGTLVAQ